MKQKAFKYALFVAILALFVAALGVTAEEPGPDFAPAYAEAAAGSGIVREPKGATGEAVYLVNMSDAPLASYRGGIQSLAATSPAALGTGKLDINSAASVAYRQYLAQKQADFMAAAAESLSRPVEAIYRYDVAFNGVAITLTPAEAATVAKLPGVASVQRDFLRQKQTDVTPDFLGAVNIWDGSASGGVATKGEGVIVGVIDTGIWPEHASFEDDGSYPAPVGFSGGCSTPEDGTAGYTCTDKLVGVQHFLAGYVVGQGGYDGSFLSGRDDDGHGTHTASTAAGNEDIAAEIFGIDRGLISGIAPRAHVAAYKALGPAGGYGSDLVAAIDKAVADGVDVINYSIGGGSSNPWQDGDALAFLAARDAGVFVATSAGNSGPGAETLGSPGDAPWITTVGASTSNRHFISDITLEGPGTPPTGLYGATVTDGVSEFNLVDAEGIPDEEGDDSGLCLNPYPPGTFEATDVVLCQRGVVARVVRGEHVQAGGGGGVILYNPTPQGLNTDNYVIPAVHVEDNIGLQIKAYLEQHPGQVTVSFTQGEKVFDSDPRVTADVMASFSSRGPNAAEPDIIKPDVTAPGVQILAGASPEHDNDGAQGELFQAIQGTSMSSPHVAGAGALLSAVHPDWTPAQIESALMTTANTTHVKEDGTTPADPFDMGAGRIDLNVAAQAPLVLDETLANYEAANPGIGGSPASLNRASLGNNNCVLECSWTRTVENVTDAEMTWDASVSGLSGSVSPDTFTLQAGETQELDVTVNAAGLPNGQWAFGQVNLVPQTGGAANDVPSTHMPIAIVPNTGDVPDLVTIETRRDAGSYLIEDVTAIEITQTTIQAYGLELAQQMPLFLEEDETNDSAYDDLGQVFWKLIPVGADSARLVNEILESTAPDVDMFVGFDENGNGEPDEDEELCASTSGSWNEYCNIDDPEAGDWWVLVQNWASSGGGVTDQMQLATAVVPMEDAGNMSFDTPPAVPALQPFDIRLQYDLENAYAGQVWYGAFTLGTAPGSPGNLGTVNVDLYRIEDDVVKTTDVGSALPGDEVTFTITVNPNVLNEEVDYEIVDTIPEGMTYVANSAEASSGNVIVSGDTVSWTGTLGNPFDLQPTYNLSTSDSDPLCDTPFGGYVNLEDFGITVEEGIEGDTQAWLYFSSGDPTNFYGQDYAGMWVTDDGFTLFDAANNYAGEPWTPQLIPDADAPNNLAAILWQDMEIVHDAETNRGVAAATASGGAINIVEYDDVQIFDDPGNTYDFEIIIVRAVDDAPGAYEIFYAYDNINGTLEGPLTVGAENEAGDNAVALVNNASAASVIEDGLIVCLDAVQPQVDPVTITYKVTIDQSVELGDILINGAVSTTSTVGSMEETAHAGVRIGYPTFDPVVAIGPPTE